MKKNKTCLNCGKEIPRDTNQTVHCCKRCCYEYHHIKWNRKKRKSELIKASCCLCKLPATTYYKTKPLCRNHYISERSKDKSVSKTELKELSKA